MQPPPLISPTAIPGARISNYRNSARRAIRLIGLGAAATDVVNRIGRRGLSNVTTTSRDAAVDWRTIAERTRDGDLNMIVIVCREGDEHLFRPSGDRPDMLVTFVLLQGEVRSSGHALAPHLERARQACDLFVTTTDPDYVSELIDNLAS
jgi:hypothetical protein